MNAERDHPRARRPGYLVTVLVVGSLVTLGAVTWWWTQQPPPGTPSASGGPPSRGPGPGGSGRAQPVSAGRAELRDLNLTQQAIGTITAQNTVVVRSRIDGELKTVQFAEGQTVRAGQLLAEIDPRAFEAQLAQAEGQLARDQAQLANARSDLARYQDLAARDAIARQQLDTQAALVKQLSGSIRVAEAAVETARLMLSYTRITAPIGGQVGLRLADPGNMIRAGDAAGLVVITQTQPISVVFSIPESVLPQVRARLARQDRPRVEAWDREQRSRLATGEVVSIDNAIDVATGTIRIKAQFENRDGSLFPNQFVNIRLHLETLSRALAVPVTALQRGASGAFVYVIGPEGAVAVRPVQPGPRDGEWVSIQGAVKAGEQVVTDGADRLRPGARVEVITPRATATAPDRPPWLDRLPQEVQERFMKMGPEERAEFVKRMRERQQSQQRPPPQ
jgi:multidrug efflux system membrane fusion protein